MDYKQQIAEWRKINNTFVLNRKEEGFQGVNLKVCMNTREQQLKRILQKKKKKRISTVIDHPSKTNKDIQKNRHLEKLINWQEATALKSTSI